MALPPLADILNLLPDNTQGLIEPVDLRQEATILYNAIAENEGAIANALPLTGGELTGGLYLAQDPIQPNEAATKNYVDNYALTTGFVAKAGDEMQGDLVLQPVPAGVNSAITKGYAESITESYFNSMADAIIFTDGRNTMNANYTPSLPQSVATRQYVDDNSDKNPNNLVKNPLSDQVIEGGHGIRLSDNYTPSDPLDLATKKFTETRGDLFSDGSVDMEENYIPSQPQSIATKDYIDSLEISGGQAWSKPRSGDTVEAGKGFYSVNAGDTFTVSDTDEDISFIVTDGSNSASADNPVTLEIDSSLGYTFADGTTTFEIDLAGASVEFALINGVWELVNSGNIIFGANQELTETANTWKEPQTFEKPIPAFGEIKHNIISTRFDPAGNTGQGGFLSAPADWTITKYDTGQWVVSYPASYGYWLSPQITPWANDAASGFFSSVEVRQNSFVVRTTNHNLVPFDNFWLMSCAF